MLRWLQCNQSVILIHSLLLAKPLAGIYFLYNANDGNKSEDSVLIDFKSKKFDLQSPLLITMFDMHNINANICIYDKCVYPIVFCIWKQQQQFVIIFIVSSSPFEQRKDSFKRRDKRHKVNLNNALRGASIPYNYSTSLL